MTKIDQKIDRHGFFLEPLSLTQDLDSMHISLAPPAPHKYVPRCVSSADVANQILVSDGAWQQIEWHGCLYTNLSVERCLASSHYY